MAPSESVLRDDDPPVCPPEDVVAEVIAYNGDTPQSEEVPVQLVQILPPSEVEDDEHRTRTKVRIRFRNPVNDMVNVTTQYLSSPYGESTCEEHNNVPPVNPGGQVIDEFIELEAYCWSKIPVSVFDFFLSGDGVEGDVQIPECCNPNPQTNTILITVKVMCECPSESDADRRSLKSYNVDAVGANPPEEDNTAIRNRNSAHHCANEDYPCGDGDDVFICHYSARDGYKTYCVSEPDSDIVGHYPKDYCGQCVSESQNNISLD